MLTYPSPRTVEAHHKIQCNQGSFTLKLRNPSYAERLEDEGLQLQFLTSGDGKDYARQTMRRLENCAIGWTEIRDDKGEPVPFSVPALVGVLTSYPEAAADVAKALSKRYEAKSVELGKFDVPPATSGEIKSGTSGPAPSPSTQNSAPSESAAGN